jgi:hypothetical protein
LLWRTRKPYIVSQSLLGRVLYEWAGEPPSKAADLQVATPWPYE